MLERNPCELLSLSSIPVVAKVLYGHSELQLWFKPRHAPLCVQRLQSRLYEVTIGILQLYSRTLLHSSYPAANPVHLNSSSCSPLQNLIRICQSVPTLLQCCNSKATKTIAICRVCNQSVVYGSQRKLFSLVRFSSLGRFECTNDNKVRIVCNRGATP